MKFSTTIGAGTVVANLVHARRWLLAARLLEAEEKSP